MKPSTLEQRNPKPFWKEPSLKHVWARTNTGAQVMICAFGYIIFCFLISRIAGPVSGVWALGFGIGGSVGWLIRDLSEPRYIKDENGEYQEINFADE
jgi:hypothetical protein